jgi:Glycosyltransferase family 9 (heptosyltransferase)
VTNLQHAYRVPPNRAAKGSRAAEWINPRAGEILIGDRDTAYKYVKKLEKRLRFEHLSGHQKSEILIARAMLYEALGDQKMMAAAEDAFKVTNTSITSHMLAVAHHHFGRLAEACKYYTLAYRFPHEAGFNVDLAYTQALLFQGMWSEAHQMTLGLKKRMVYAAYLPEWNISHPTASLSIISEGGFGDLIQMARFIPAITAMGITKATIYLPNYFFESGFVDLWRAQPWCPPIRLLTECPQNVPAVGFFDLPAKFNVQPDNIPPSVTFKVDKTSALVNLYLDKPKVGFCWAAKQQETPLSAPGVYRALTNEQALRIVDAAKSVHLVNLQLGETLPGLINPEIKSWVDTAAIIENLDAVIAVDTAVAHLAAAMGKKVYLLLSGAADWKWGMEGNTTTAWYPSIEIIRSDSWGFDVAVEKMVAKMGAGLDIA